MARWRVYLKLFNDSGVYDSDYTEVTTDVVELGNPAQVIDNNDFDVGVIRNSGFSIKFRNDHGRYSDVGSARSIFRYSRKNVQVKITWDYRDYDLIAGFFTVGDEPLGGEYTVFEGLINEVTTFSNIITQHATFNVLGFDSLFDSLEIPFSSISAGQTFSQILGYCLDQTPFNTLVTVDSTNIVPGVDLTADSVAAYENKVVGDVLEDLLLAANSVLFLKDNVVYVKERTATTDVMFTFYGQAATAELENIVNVPKYRDGMNRVFNYWTWPDTTFRARDTSSISNYGVRTKEVSVDLIADASEAKIQQVLDANRDEFSFPKIEMDLETPIWYDTLALQILDRVQIDYPTVFIPYNGGILPRYGQDFYDGTARYPFEQWTMTMSTDSSFKIMSKKIDVKKQTIIFGLREV